MLDARFARQMILKEIGQTGQLKLQQSRVLIVGVGGLGSPAALYLAAAGVGTIGLIDADRVDISNLQRQILYTTADEGQSKVERALERLQAINPELKGQIYREHLHAGNAIQIAQEYDLLIDGTDNFAAKFLLNDVAVKLGKPLIYGSVLRWEGQLALFWAPYGPCYRCLFPNPPERHVPNCAEAGVVGALAGTVGSLQALEAIKVLVSGPPPYEDQALTPLLGMLWLIRAATMETQRLRIQRNPECSVCSKPQGTIALADAEALVCAEGPREYRAKELLQGDQWAGFQWVDVREQSEWESGHVPGAWHWPLSRLQKGDWPDFTPSTRPLILYCQGGFRSRRAFELLQSQGVEAQGHLKDGFQTWQGPIEREMVH